MQILFVLASVALTTVLCAVDPTTVCLPDVFQSDVYSITNDDYGHLAIDFSKEILGIHYIRGGYRVVFNLTDFSGHIVNTTDGTCQQISAGGNIANVVTKCLPATAIALANVSQVGLAPDNINIQAWEIDIGTGVTRVGLTTGSPSVPVIREYRSGTTVDVAFYSNPSTTISHPNIFVVPDVCTPATVVG